ncbi:MAG: DotA/TraY family protein, partial [Bdellovibrionales bacterium]
FLGAMFILTLLLSVFIGQAHAADTTSTASLFTSPYEKTDWAQNWINYLFSGKEIPAGSQEVPQPSSCEIQNALGACLSIYSSAILVLAGFLLIYHLVFMVAEQAHTGKLMGKANQIWAPIRLVFAIGMLVPLTTASTTTTANCNGSINGYNTAQYMMVTVAEWGSGLASTVWKKFVVALENQKVPACTSSDKTSATCILPSTDYAKIVRALMAMDACAYFFNQTIEPYNSISRVITNDDVDSITSTKVKTYRVPRLSSLGFSINQQKGAFLGIEMTNKARSNYKSFFLKDKDTFCGGYIAPPYTSTEYDKVRNEQYNAISQIAADVASETKSLAAPYLNDTVSEIAQETIKAKLNDFVSSLKNNTEKSVASALADADESVQSKLTAEYKSSDYLVSGGWLTAPSWFSSVIRVQAARSDSVYAAMPIFVYPAAFRLGSQDLTSDQQSSGGVYLVPSEVKKALEKYMKALDSATNDFYSAGDTQVSEDKPVDKFLYDVDQQLAGTGIWQSGSIGLRFGVTSNPMAELASFGQKCVNVALLIMAGGAAGSVIGIFFSGAALLASFAFAVGAILFTVGFTLGYVVPLYPFYRFFFGSLKWIMTVMEAIVIAPLFALAHIEPQGEGLAGKRAAYGYSVLTQLILRPVLMIFGLIVGHLLFIVTLAFLNDAFIFAVKGTGTFSQGLDVIGKIVYTAIYAGIVLILANQCYSTIGLFPQVALRWLGLGQIHEEGFDTGTITAVAASTAAHISGKIPAMAGRVSQYGKEKRQLWQQAKDDKEAARQKGIDRGIWEDTAKNAKIGNALNAKNNAQIPSTGASGNKPNEPKSPNSGDSNLKNAQLAKQDMQSDPEYLASDRESQQRQQGQQPAEGSKEDYSQMSPPSSGETAQSDNRTLPPPDQPPAQPAAEPDPKTKQQQDEWLAKTDGGKKKPDTWNPEA